MTDSGSGWPGPAGRAGVGALALAMSVLSSAVFSQAFGCRVPDVPADPGPGLIFPWGAADPTLLDGTPARPLPATAPRWARSAEVVAARHYVTEGLRVEAGFARRETPREIVFVLSRPTGGNMVATSLALWTRRGDGRLVETWRLDEDPRARTAIARTHAGVDGEWGDGIVWTHGERELLEAFAYHNYPYPRSSSRSGADGKAHSAAWADEVTIFERSGDAYIPVGSGVTYYQRGRFPTWPVGEKAGPWPPVPSGSGAGQGAG